MARSPPRPASETIIKHSAHGLLAPLAPQPDADAVRAALARIVTSSGMARAPRMCRLLAFLVRHSLTGALRHTAEYAIGIDVFDRDPARYDTCDDPIVRVQMGRLRNKLRQYYDGVGSADPVRLAIPLGSYALQIGNRAAASGQARLALQPLRALDPGGALQAFAGGVCEELACRLHGALGPRLCPREARPHAAAPALALPSPAWLETAPRRLEGSLRADAGQVRVALRLADGDSGHLLAAQLFDFAPGLTIAAQETVARVLGAWILERLNCEGQL